MESPENSENSTSLPPSPHEKGHSRKKKKRPLWLKLLAILGIVLVIILGAGWGYVNHMLGKINRPDFQTISPEDFVEETDADVENSNLETLSPEEITLQLADQVLKDKDVINILLIGQDTQEHVSGTRSDSMILATINQEKNEITITSFMRDLYVDIPGYRASRINSAYTLGGPELLDQTIELNFGIHIDGNIAIDFTGFARCIDIVGGVDMDLSLSEAAVINKEVYKSQPSLISGSDLMADRWALRGGKQHLTGEQALQYARIREIDSDFSRTNRQRKLLTALFEKLKNSDLATVNALLDEALPLLTTDISNTRLIGYAAAVLSMQPSTFKTDRIPADGAYREAVVRGMQVLVPDLGANQLHLKESLYGSDSTSYVPAPTTAARKKQSSKRTQSPAPAPETAPAPAANPYETLPVPESMPEETGGIPETSQTMPEGTYEYGPGMPTFPSSQGGSAGNGGIQSPGETAGSDPAAGSETPQTQPETPPALPGITLPETSALPAETSLPGASETLPESAAPAVQETPAPETSPALQSTEVPETQPAETPLPQSGAQGMDSALGQAFGTLPQQ
ncbi:MAG TPA: LCP family protein [Candidatus Cottocaccamicrobium excrementipullorum]|nr:LCP family protein [Candidatus Cottocaccamicrobium excrementipullorum]